MGELIPRQDVDRFEGRIAQIVQVSQDIEIHTDRQFLEANSMLREVNELYKTIAEFIEPFRKAAKANYDTVLARKKALLEPLKAGAQDELKRKLAAWKQQEDRKRRAAKERALQAAQKEAEAAQEQKVADAMEAGDFETAEKVMDAEPLPDPEAVDLPPDVPKAHGVQYRERWTAEASDLKKLCQAIADGKPGATLDLIKLDTTKANAMARHMKEELTRLDIGLRAVKHTDVAVR
jgi:hypothetical protein